jgi:sec-independent protein translocase protein TatB
MPSFQDSAVIFFLALLLFGPKKLPELARQLGKLMAEFRRASNEFRMQMEDELRIADQAEQQKKIAAMEAAAPIPPVIPAIEDGIPSVTDGSENTIAPPDLIDGQPHQPAAASEAQAEPLPIATSGELNLMPPSTGLPVASSSVSRAFDSIPHSADQTDPANESVVQHVSPPVEESAETRDASSAHANASSEASLHG